MSVVNSVEEWRPFGFDDLAAAAWHHRGFGPLEAALARDDGFTPFNAQHDPKGTARFRQRWAEASLEPPDARRWHQWNFTAAEAARWSRAGFDLASASMWRTMGSPPIKQLGWPTDHHQLRKRGPDNAGAVLTPGGSQPPRPVWGTGRSRPRLGPGHANLDGSLGGAYPTPLVAIARYPLGTTSALVASSPAQVVALLGLELSKRIRAFCRAPQCLSGGGRALLRVECLYHGVRGIPKTVDGCVDPVPSSGCGARILADSV